MDYNELIKEKEMLIEKIIRLELMMEAELNNGLTAPQMSILNIQIAAMKTQLQCMTEFLAWFPLVER